MSSKIFLDSEKYELERNRRGDIQGRPLTHGEIAREVGISRTSLDYLRRGQYSPSPATMGNLAEFFGVEDNLNRLFVVRKIDEGDTKGD